MSGLSRSFLVLSVFFIGEDLVDEILLGAVTHLLLDLLPAALDHEVAVLAPEAVVSFVPKTG